MPLRPIGTLLGATDQLKALSARARRVRELQKLYAETAPRALAHASRVKNLRAGTLLIAADNAAVAAKLKQVTPTLLASLRKSEGEITAIKIEVQVTGALHERVPQTQKTPLTSDAIDEFAALAKRIPDGKLRAALARMVRRHRKARSTK